MKSKRILIFGSVVIFAIILRFYKLGSNPPGLYWDEAVFGYDAYSISKTLHDHHGRFLPIFFESFGDWKLPVYHYLLIPSIKLFGLDELAVRAPSALSGVFLVIVFFFLIGELTKNWKLALVGMLMLGISPWHIQFSRAGFETGTGLFLATVGIYFLLKGINKKSSPWITLSFLFLVLSMYSYHAYRIFTPLLTLSVLLIYRYQAGKILRQFIFPVVGSTILLIPLVTFSFSSEGRARAISQSAFKKEDLNLQKIDFDQKSKKPFRFLSKYPYSAPVYYSYVALNGYLDHFSPEFLFFSGDPVGRHSQVDMGQIYLFDAFFLLAAILVIKKFESKSIKLMLVWLLLAPLPAAIVTQTPHANRAFQMVIPITFFSSIGAYWLFSSKINIIFKSLLGLLIAYSLLAYLHLLFVHYPKKFANDWQDGYKQMVHELIKYQDQFNKVYITNVNQVPYVYVLFYQKYDPTRFILLNGDRYHLDKYYFVSSDVDLYHQGRILYIAPSWQKVDGKWLAAANDSFGRHIYSLWEINGQK